MKKQPELTARTRQKLVDAYFALRQTGVNPTVGAIAQRSGYNRCTFYRYFTDTGQLLAQVEEEICAAFRVAIQPGQSALVHTEILPSLVRVYTQYGNPLSVLLGAQGDPRFVARMKKIMSPLAQQLLAEESDTPFIAALKVEMALSAVLAAVTKWYDEDKPIPMETLGEVVTNFLTGSLRHTVAG